MKDSTLLLRQIHPKFLVNDEPGSVAFRPTRKDKSRLSFDDGDQIDPERSWQRYTAKGLESAGVVAVSVGECEDEALTVENDGVPEPEHVSVDFSGKGTSARKRASKILRDHATTRGWLVRR